MKIRVGIVGYGNLGKAVEEIVLSSQNLSLVAIFSRRLTNSRLNSKIESYDKILDYKNKIDVMFLCGSSKNDIMLQATELSTNFNTINTFDTHKKIKTLTNELSSINKAHNTVSISACGWDPGLFSIVRTLFYAISKSNPYTFWGKGISMGHSDAIRQVSGVEDAVEFTTPNEEAVTLAKKGTLDKNTPMHIRECFVVTAKSNEKRVSNEIRNIPNYFKGQPTNISFVNDIKMFKLKSKLSHKGQILSKYNISNNSLASMNFSVSMQSNPMFTASIMTAYARAVIRLSSEKKYGAYTPLDIPPILLFDKRESSKIITKFC